MPKYSCLQVCCQSINLKMAIRAETCSWDLCNKRHISNHQIAVFDSWLIQLQFIKTQWGWRTIWLLVHDTVLHYIRQIFLCVRKPLKFSCWMFVIYNLTECSYALKYFCVGILASLEVCCWTVIQKVVSAIRGQLWVWFSGRVKLLIYQI